MAQMFYRGPSSRLETLIEKIQQTKEGLLKKLLVVYYRDEFLFRFMQSCLLLKHVEPKIEDNPNKNKNELVIGFLVIQRRINTKAK